MARILQVFRPRTGGTFGHVRVLSAALADHGHEVAVCGPGGPGDAFAVPHVEAAIPRAPSPAATLAAVRDVGRAYRSFRPDLIHAHGAQAGVVARLARPALPAAPLVHTPHRYAFDDGGGRSPARLLYAGLERGLMPVTTRVLCVSEAERRLAVGLGAGDRAVVVHNGIEPLEPSPLEPRLAELAAGGPLIVAVSELFSRKGVPVLLEAMGTVLGAYPEARLIVAGEGPDRAEAEAARDRLGLGRRALLAGHVDGIGGLLAAADVFVNPALAESFPYGILEAMSLACPCVVTAAGGSAEAIVDGRSGRVVPPGDAAALAAAIIGLIADPATARGYGDAAARRVRERFTRAAMIDGTEAVYAELLAD
ncbi:MAG TPA: glycosyltransferase family 4 protein [Solirubrobacterales bacterium]|nr:glycosyltransferase family 4 protein [Solirubrobacterales bacterium]